MRLDNIILLIERFVILLHASPTYSRTKKGIVAAKLSKNLAATTPSVFSFF
jgi:hypothetical protein